jgi:hypothetical protein
LAQSVRASRLTFFIAPGVTCGSTKPRHSTGRGAGTGTGTSTSTSTNRKSPKVDSSHFLRTKENGRWGEPWPVFPLAVPCSAVPCWLLLCADLFNTRGAHDSKSRIPNKRHRAYPRANSPSFGAGAAAPICYRLPALPHASTRDGDSCPSPRAPPD